MIASSLSFAKPEDLIQAERQLLAALESKPGDPDLNAELALVYLYARREAKAIKLYPRALGAQRQFQLAQGIYDHLYCLAQRGEPHERLEHLEFFRGLVETPSPNVGIRISACLIVRDEEDNLPACLDSLKNVVDEVVVVDTGSQDRTVQIADAYGAKIGHFAWVQDFAAARNHALSLATGNWILWIDADEVLSLDSAEALREAVIRPQFGGYGIEIISYTANEGENERFVHQPVRLFQNRPGVRFEHAIHEQIAPSIEALGLPCVPLTGIRLFHEGYRPEQMARRNKIARNVSLLEDAVRRSPNDGFAWFNLANTLRVAERFGEAEHAARTAARLLRPSDDVGELCYQILAVSLATRGQYVEAIRACQDADDAGFGGMLIDFERANAYVKLGDYENAHAAIDACLAREWRPGEAGDLAIATYKRQFVKGQILSLLGRNKEALGYLRRGLEIAPDYAPGWFLCALAAQRTGLSDEAEAAFQNLRNFPDFAPHAERGLAEICSARGDLPEASARFETAYRLRPSDHDAWVGWVKNAEASGDLPSLLRAYQAVADQGEMGVDVLINWGRTLAQAGDAERALRCFTEAITRAPEDPNAYFNCGDLLYQLGAYADAAHLYESGLRLTPEFAQGWFTLGNCLGQLSLNEGAVTAYDQCLRLMPSHRDAAHNRGLCIAA